MKRTSLKRTQMQSRSPKRVWKAALLKRAAEGQCRVCRSPYELEIAHVAGREYDQKNDNGTRVVHEDSVVILCSAHHRAFDAHELDLLPYLSVPEQMRAVHDSGGIYAALKRISGREG